MKHPVIIVNGKSVIYPRSMEVEKDYVELNEETSGQLTDFFEAYGLVLLEKSKDKIVVTFTELQEAILTHPSFEEQTRKEQKRYQDKLDKAYRSILDGIKKSS